MADLTKDLWWEARQKSAADGLNKPELFREVIVSLRGTGTKRTFVPTALAQRPDVVIMPDFNLYRPGRDLKMYIDAGCKAFLLRIGGPKRWVEGAWDYAVDTTYYSYLEQAAKYGVTGQTIGYIVHNPFEAYTPNGATGETPHTELLDDWTSGGKMPQAFMYDHEIAKAWRGSGAEITCTPFNLAQSLAENTLNTYKKFKRIVSIYSACWFLRGNAGTEHYTYFYNVNKPESMGGPGLQRPLVLAWYPGIPTKQYTDISTVFADLIDPTPEQIKNFLFWGWQGNAWQFTDRLRIGTDTQGVDCSISLDPTGAFYENFGLVKPGAVTPPPPPADGGTGEQTAGAVTRAEYDAALARITGLENKLAEVKMIL